MHSSLLDPAICCYSASSSGVRASAEYVPNADMHVLYLVSATHKPLYSSPFYAVLSRLLLLLTIYAPIEIGVASLN